MSLAWINFKIVKRLFVISLGNENLEADCFINGISSVPVMVCMATNIDTAIFVSEDSHDSYYMKHNFKN